jgi:cytochrome c oxidase subunit 2
MCSLLLAGCSGWQSALDPRGPQAEHLAFIIWLFTGVCTATWIAVMVALVTALLRRRAQRADPLATNAAREMRAGRVVLACTALTAMTVIALTILSYASQRKLFSKEADALELHLIGHQWWWEIRYEDGPVDRRFTSANEMHIPVGRPVKVKLDSQDVIHSLWVPSLAGKMDLITGQHNELEFVAAREGVYRAQCAEFCGYQHAHMAMLVRASSGETFQSWRQAQLKDAEPPANPEQERGKQAFLSKSCALCHAIRGTPAASTVGPDLTHVGSRLTIAAGVLPMSRGNLAAWIADPQGIKPGANMPLTDLAPQELDALAGYLTGLK